MQKRFNMYKFSENELYVEIPNKPDYISLIEFKTLATEAQEKDIKDIILSGEGLTEHPDFLKILEDTCSRGFDISIITDGNWTRNWAEEFDKYKVKQVQFSYQGKEDTDAQLQAIQDVEEVGIDVVLLGEDE